MTLECVESFGFGRVQDGTDVETGWGEGGVVSEEFESSEEHLVMAVPEKARGVTPLRVPLVFQPRCQHQKEKNLRTSFHGAHTSARLGKVLTAEQGGEVPTAGSGRYCWQRGHD